VDETGDENFIQYFCRKVSKEKDTWKGIGVDGLGR
jgi:hypothetical protein